MAAYLFALLLTSSTSFYRRHRAKRHRRGGGVMWPYGNIVRRAVIYLARLFIVCPPRSRASRSSRIIRSAATSSSRLLASLNVNIRDATMARAHVTLIIISIAHSSHHRALLAASSTSRVTLGITSRIAHRGTSTSAAYHHSVRAALAWRNVAHRARALKRIAHHLIIISLASPASLRLARIIIIIAPRSSLASQYRIAPLHHLSRLASSHLAHRCLSSRLHRSLGSSSSSRQLARSWRNRCSLASAYRGIITRIVSHLAHRSSVATSLSYLNGGVLSAVAWRSSFSAWLAATA